MFLLIESLPVELATEAAITASLRAWRRVEDSLEAISSRGEASPLSPLSSLSPLLSFRNENIFALRGAWKGSLRLMEPRRSLHRLFENREACPGEFFFTTQRLYFWAADQTCGFAVDYEDVLLHALQRGNGVDEEDNAASLYLQLATSDLEGGNDDDSGTDSGTDSDAESGETQFAELVFIPEGSGADVLAVVEEMFLALSDCSALHPSFDEDSCTSGNDSSSSTDLEEGEEMLDGNGEPISGGNDSSKRPKLAASRDEVSSSPSGSR